MVFEVFDTLSCNTVSMLKTFCIAFTSWSLLYENTCLVGQFYEFTILQNIWVKFTGTEDKIQAIPDLLITCNGQKWIPKPKKQK